MVAKSLMSIHRLVLYCFVTWILAAGAALADGGDRYPPLRESFDPGLQEDLDRTITSLGLGAAVRRGELAVALVDISDLEEPRMAEVNGDTMLYAASLPKIAILLGAFVEIERGRLTLDAKTRDSLTQMIRVSSNVEATRMLNKVGKERLLEILQSEELRLYDPLVGGGLWVGKEYGKSPAFRRDPMKNLSHAATAMQAARFYYLMETGQLVGPLLTATMKGMLGDPGINHKFVKGLSNVPGAKIYRKSGSWRHWHADSALIEHGPHKYIVVALAANADGGNWLARLIGPLHRAIVPQDIAQNPQ